MIDLSGKTVLVTGGSRGIGEAIVRAVAAAGGKVLLHYVKSRAAAEKIQTAIGRDVCQLIPADLATPRRLPVFGGPQQPQRRASMCSSTMPASSRERQLMRRAKHGGTPGHMSCR